MPRRDMTPRELGDFVDRVEVWSSATDVELGRLRKLVEQTSSWAVVTVREGDGDWTST